MANKKVFLFASILILSLLLVVFAYSRESHNVNKISFEEYIRHIDSTGAHEFEIIFKDLLDAPSEGGRGVLWLLNNRLVKMEIYAFGSMGQTRTVYSFYEDYIFIDIHQIFYKEAFDVENIAYSNRRSFILGNQRLYEIDYGRGIEVLLTEEEKDEMIETLLYFSKALGVEMILK